MPERNAPDTSASGKPSLFAKPHLDDMGRSGSYAVPAGGKDKSLFRKQDHREAHGADYGTPDDGRSPSARPGAAPDGAPSRSEPRSGDSASAKSEDKSLFRKNSLDEMTVGRTEKPVGKTPPKKQPISPLVGEMSGRTEGGAKERGASSDDPKPVKRHRPGLGSYEDPADERQRNRRPKKTGRPGR